MILVLFVCLLSVSWGGAGGGVKYSFKQEGTVLFHTC